MIASSSQHRRKSAPRETPELTRLVRDRGIGPHVIFFLDGESEILPNGAEASSGYVLDRLGRVYAFWVGWDAEHEAATFSLWEPVDSDPAWLEDAEYSRALDILHLSPRSRSRDTSGGSRYPSRVASITAFA